MMIIRLAIIINIIIIRSIVTKGLFDSKASTVVLIAVSASTISAVRMHIYVESSRNASILSAELPPSEIIHHCF